jgi:hypothetical protein
VPVILSLLTAVIACPNGGFFWRAVLIHYRKFSAHQEMRPPEISAEFSRRKTEHHTSHLALRTVFLMFTSLTPNDFGAKPLYLLGAIIVTECESDNGGEGRWEFWQLTAGHRRERNRSTSGRSLTSGKFKR